MSHDIGQLIFIGISGHSLTAEEKKFIVENNISGITLFGRNVAEPKQVHDLCSEIQSLRHQTKDKIPFFIAIDMEGGRVHRLKSPFTQWPAVANLGRVNNPTLSFDFARCMGNELQSVGINLDWAPCVDIFSNPKNTIIGDRSAGTTVDLVETHSSAMVRGYVKSGIISCAKHFPGHGNTLIDSHLDLPIEEKTLDELRTLELLPFKKAMRARVDMIMSAHIRYPQIDPDWPATLSAIFLKKLLREELRFRGIVVTDDLGMGALAKYHKKEDIPVRALQAGVDMLLYCNEPDSPPVAIESVFSALANGKLSKDQIQQSYNRVISLKKEKLQNPDPMNLDLALEIINCAEHQKIVDQLKA